MAIRTETRTIIEFSSMEIEDMILAQCREVISPKVQRTDIRIGADGEGRPTAVCNFLVEKKMGVIPAQSDKE